MRVWVSLSPQARSRVLSSRRTAGFCCTFFAASSWTTSASSTSAPRNASGIYLGFVHCGCFLRPQSRTRAYAPVASMVLPFFRSFGKVAFTQKKTPTGASPPVGVIAAYSPTNCCTSVCNVAISAFNSATSSRLVRFAVVFAAAFALGAGLVSDFTYVRHVASFAAL